MKLFYFIRKLNILLKSYLYFSRTTYSNAVTTISMTRLIFPLQSITNDSSYKNLILQYIKYKT